MNLASRLAALDVAALHAPVGDLRNHLLTTSRKALREAIALNKTQPDRALKQAIALGDEYVQRATIADRLERGAGKIKAKGQAFERRPEPEVCGNGVRLGFFAGALDKLALQIRRGDVSLTQVGPTIEAVSREYFDAVKQVNGYLKGTRGA